MPIELTTVLLPILQPVLPEQSVHIQPQLGRALTSSKSLRTTICTVSGRSVFSIASAGGLSESTIVERNVEVKKRRQFPSLVFLRRIASDGYLRIWMLPWMISS